MYQFNTNQILYKLGISDGRTQRVLDSQVVHYLRETMPVDTGTMRANTRIEKPGLIRVATPYAHYVNEGILYVMPDNGKGAFYSPSYGFWSKPGVKKVPSDRSLNYSGGTARGQHFVERTIYGHKDDIIKTVAKEMMNK